MGQQLPGNEERDAWAASLDGLPMTMHHPATPEGRIEQAGKIAAGLRARRTGWRQLYVRVGGGLLVLVALAAGVAFIAIR